ncbi:MAG TPA: nucleotidyltransferase domain-containing protein [Ignavibacteria bacterium]
MVKNKPEIISTIKECLKELEKFNIKIEKAILFGSYANGNYNEWSDIDVALVSADFEGDRFIDRIKVRNITRKINIDFEPLPMRPEDFNSPNPFVKQILKTGQFIVG